MTNVSKTTKKIKKTEKVDKKALWSMFDEGTISETEQNKHSDLELLKILIKTLLYFLYSIL